MTEEDRSVTTKDSRVAEVTSPPTSSPAPVPWSAEEQKVEFTLTNMIMSKLLCPPLPATREGFTYLSSVRREQVGQNRFYGTVTEQAGMYSAIQGILTI